MNRTGCSRREIPSHTDLTLSTRFRWVCTNALGQTRRTRCIDHFRLVVRVDFHVGRRRFRAILNQREKRPDLTGLALRQDQFRGLRQTWKYPVHLFPAPAVQEQHLEARVFDHILENIVRQLVAKRHGRQPQHIRRQEDQHRLQTAVGQYPHAVALRVTRTGQSGRQPVPLFPELRVRHRNVAQPPFALLIGLPQNAHGGPIRVLCEAFVHQVFECPIHIRRSPFYRIRNRFLPLEPRRQPL